MFHFLMFFWNRDRLTLGSSVLFWDVESLALHPVGSTGSSSRGVASEKIWL